MNVEFAVGQVLYCWMIYCPVMSFKDREGDGESLEDRVRHVIEEDRDLFDALDE